MGKIHIGILAVVMLSITAVSSVSAQTLSNSVKQTDWIASVIKDIQMIKVGMTRVEMRKVFGEEGGLSNTSQRTYVYLGCPYIKVDFEFESRGPETKTADGRYMRPESDLDIIKKMSKPYLAFSTMD